MPSTQHTSGRGDPWLFLASFTLVSLGLVMIYSASYAVAEEQFGEPDYFITKQLIAAGLGLVCLVIASRLPLWVYANLSWFFMAVALLLLVLVLIPDVGLERGGSRRWFGLGPVLFQPSEFAKLALVLWFAFAGARRQDSPAGYRRFLWETVPVLLLTCVLIVAEPNLSTTILCGAVGLGVMFHAGLKAEHTIVAALVGVLAVGFIVSQNEYMGERFGQQEVEAPGLAGVEGRNYQVRHCLIALGSGGIYGRGLTHSGEKFGYLPARHNDAIFAIVGEELGFAGTVGVLCLFAFVGWRGYRAAVYAQDPFARLVAGGITTAIVLQALINMAVVTDLMPTTGMTLPFISYGGSSLVMALASVGILLRTTAEIPAGCGREEDTRFASRPERRGHRRSLVPGPYHR